MIARYIVLLCCAPASFAQEQWSQFRGPHGSGVTAAEVPLPSTLDKEVNLVWSCEIPEGHSSPVFWNEHVFLTGHADGKLLTLCLDRATGELRWRKSLEPESLERLHRVNSPASPTPATDGAHVSVYFGSFGLVTYDLEGKELWRRPMPMAENTFGTGASPIYAGGRLILVRDTNGESFVEALEPATGETVWRVDRPDFGSGWSTPAVWQRGGSHELLVYGVWWLTAYDLADGSRLWAFPGLTDEPIVMPATGEGLVFVTSYNMKTNPEVIGLPEFDALLAELDANEDGRLDREEAAKNDSVLSRFDADGEGDHPLRIFFRRLDEDRDGFIAREEYAWLANWVDGFAHANGIMAIRPGTGSGEDATATEVAWQFARGVPECPSPLYYRGRLYVLKNGGMATCLEARTGELLFQERVGARGPMYASPVAGDGKIYAASARGEVAVFAAKDELEILALNDLDERIMATPALVDGRVYVRTEARLYAFGSKD